MGEVAAEVMWKEKVAVEACPALEIDHGTTDEREEAVAAAVAVVGASARRGVVALCASVAHIIRKNFRLQQQVKDLENRLRALERLTGIPEDSSATSQCQEYSSAASQCQEYSSGTSQSQEYSSAASQCPSTSDSLPESPESQRCGSAPPQFPAGLLRPYRGPGAGVRKASDPESGAVFMRGHTRASTGNLSRCGPGVASSFVRRKYSSISLRRVRRATLSAARLGRTATAGSERSSTTSLEQQDSNSNSSKSCIVTVAEVYPSPDATATTTNNNGNREGDAVKLLAQKLTSVLQEDITQLQDDAEDMVLSAPHPLAGCECVLCFQLAADSDILPYEIITDEGSLLPRGSSVLVRGRRVGTVVYFGHRKHQARGTNTLQTPLLPPSAHGSCEAPADGCARSLASPLGVMVQLWLPDEGEVFVPLNDVICQLDEEGIPGSHEDPSTLALEEGSNNRQERTPSTEARKNSTSLDSTLTDTQGNMTGDSWITGEVYDITESRGHPRDRHCSSASNSSSTYESLESGHEATQTAREGTLDTAKRPTAVTASNTDVALKRSVTGVDHRFPDSPKRNRRAEGNHLDCEEDVEAHYLECDKGKLQFGDTWDSGCYMSLGRHSSECSEQFSDLDSEYGSTSQPWASSLEEALNSVWKKHRHQEALSHYVRRPQVDTFVLDTEIELQDYRYNKKMGDDTVC